ncbi:V-type ATP synthase subunit I [Trichlorobacter ammonificans]|uniref:V-type ATP synthase subunit I n=1 Tax=Trichlorobacter ammonificans TaxID=2916410 RepID=A0ABN8HH49_9BACT|nr:V-type ATPase 116kDa subunit family protein [Trichlorobacter ammonificans]CAH2032131.1 V-type ATP synthase subunit I [Trichlorobacter ammonificans]
MIVSMSRLEVAGPRELLLEVLELIREQGIFQIEEEETGVSAADERVVAERLFLENLRRRTGEIIALLPSPDVTASRLDPLTVLDTIAVTVTQHLDFCRNLEERRQTLRREEEELARYEHLLTAIDRLISDRQDHDGLEFIGITLRDPSWVERLREALTLLVDGEYTLTTTRAGDGTLIGLIAAPPSRSAVIRKALNNEQLPELPLPESVGHLPLPQRIARLQERLAELRGLLAAVDGEREQFARRWLAFYRRIDHWLAQRLALLAATGSVRRTGMCFVIHGWALSERSEALATALNSRFGGRVVLERRDILEHDLDKVPVALRNPPYIRPFELFTRLLPLPRYSSWDPTPFIAVFFPLFFGMMLGDAGHGLVLLLAALWLRRRRPTGAVGDGARILLVSSSYAILFGMLFGEFFGEAGGRLLHLTPLLPERSTAVLPMLVFSLALGGCHMLLGMLLGVISALRHHQRSEAVARVAGISLIACLAMLAVSRLYPSPWLLSRPILLLIGLLLPLLVLSGGLLAPLEMVKTIGNIVSYARIMAIGLSSALLANAANHLAGLSGNLVLGALAAIALHGVAILLGLFAPAIHGLRLHFVEFLGTFVEPGGRRFEPLRKE